MALGDKVFGAMAWSAIERLLLQGIQFILGIVLARILSPEEYGVMAILMVFIVFSSVFIDSGFSMALTQKINRTENDKSTVLLFNLGISIFCYCLLWISSKEIAKFYEILELEILLKFIGVSLIINALYTVPNTLFTIQLDFKSITKINLIAVVISGIFAIFLALNGFGVWSLVYQVLLKSVLTLVFTWFLIKWWPNWTFSKKSFKELFSYGSKLLASSLLAHTFSNINTLLIGKYISAKELGFYSRGTQFSDVVFNVFNSSINNVLLPGLAPLQNDKSKLVLHSKTIIRSTTLVVLPAFLTLSILAEPIIIILLTDKWAKAIPIMQLFSIARLVTIIGGINMNILYVIGRTDLVLRQQYLCIAIRAILVLSALPFGIFYIALAELTTSIIHFFINAYFPGKLLGYKAINQIKDNLLILFSGVVMALLLYSTFFLFNDYLTQLLVTPVIAIVAYFLMLYYLKVHELFMLIEKIKGFFSR